MRRSHITNDTHSRRPYILQTNCHALIKLSTRQKLMTPSKCRAYQPKAGKSDAALKAMRPAKLTCQIRAKAPALRKSP
jgi:hypothetical protein